jgi:hypothetical protein
VRQRTSVPDVDPMHALVRRDTAMQICCLGSRQSSGHMELDVTTSVPASMQASTQAWHLH